MKIKHSLSLLLLLWLSCNSTALPALSERFMKDLKDTETFISTHYDINLKPMNRAGQMEVQVELLGVANKTTYIFPLPMLGLPPAKIEVFGLNPIEYFPVSSTSFESDTFVYKVRLSKSLINDHVYLIRMKYIANFIGDVSENEQSSIGQQPVKNTADEEINPDYLPNGDIYQEQPQSNLEESVENVEYERAEEPVSSEEYVDDSDESFTPKVPFCPIEYSENLEFKSSEESDSSEEYANRSDEPFRSELPLRPKESAENEAVDWPGTPDSSEKSDYGSDEPAFLKESADAKFNSEKYITPITFPKLSSYKTEPEFEINIETTAELLPTDDTMDMNMLKNLMFRLWLTVSSMAARISGCNAVHPLLPSIGRSQCDLSYNLEACPAGLHFNPLQGICDHPSKVNCQGANLWLPYKVKQMVWDFPNPWSCENYYSLAPLCHDPTLPDTSRLSCKCKCSKKVTTGSPENDRIAYQLLRTTPEPKKENITNLRVNITVDPNEGIVSFKVAKTIQDPEKTNGTSQMMNITTNTKKRNRTYQLRKTTKHPGNVGISVRMAKTTRVTKVAHSTYQLLKTTQDAGKVNSASPMVTTTIDTDKGNSTNQLQKTLQSPGGGDGGSFIVKTAENVDEGSNSTYQELKTTQEPKIDSSTSPGVSTKSTNKVTRTHQERKATQVPKTASSSLPVNVTTPFAEKDQSISLIVNTTPYTKASNGTSQVVNSTPYSEEEEEKEEDDDNDISQVVNTTSGTKLVTLLEQQEDGASLKNGTANLLLAKKTIQKE